MKSKHRVLLLIVMLAFCSITGFSQSGPIATNQRYAIPHNASIPYDYYLQNLNFINSSLYGFGFYKNGSPAQILLSMPSSGNVGVGVENPSDKLEVAGNIGINSNGRVTFGRAGTGTGDFITNASNLGIGNGLALGTSTYARMVVTASGLVGIGTYTPASLLDVAGDINVSGFGRVITNAANGHIFTQGATANIYTTSGKMGVGITPGGGSEKLEVNGNLKATGTGNIYTVGSNGNIYTTGGQGYIYTTTGKVGIGTTPGAGSEKLEVAGNIKTSGTIFTTGASAAGAIYTTGVNANIFTSATNASIGTLGSGGNIYTTASDSYIYTIDGKMGVGIVPSPTTEKFEVVGNIKSTGLMVKGVASVLSNPANVGKVINPTQSNGKKYSLFVDYGVVSEDFILANVSTWADYVFEKDYKLPSLNDVESYISKNKHLPGVPDQEEVKKGYGVHDMNTVFLQKIEELTLYAIEQNKKIDRLVAEIEELKKK